MIADNKDMRAEFIAEKPFCFVCGGTLWARTKPGYLVTALCVDEILHGHGPRGKAYCTRELCIVSCNYCNCHVTNVSSPEMLAELLARKRQFDPEHFSLQAVRQAKENGRHPRVIEMGEVIEAGNKLGFDTEDWSE